LGLFVSPHNNFTGLKATKIFKKPPITRSNEFFGSTVDVDNRGIVSHFLTAYLVDSVRAEAETCRLTRVEGNRRAARVVTLVSVIELINMEDTPG
jgi:hypothetical protein